MMLLQTIQPGSYVWIHGRRLGETVRRYERVLRRTPTQFVIDDEFQSRFRRSSGEELGGLYDYIVGPASVEEMAAFDLEKAARAAREQELGEEERQLRVLLTGFAIELTRQHNRYAMRFPRITASQVRSLISVFKGYR